MIDTSMSSAPLFEAMAQPQAAWRGSPALVAVSDYLAAAFLDPAALPEVEVSYDNAARTLWCWRPRGGAPSFTPALLRDLNAVYATLGRRDLPAGVAPPLYFAAGAKTPGTFNLGGDLAFFLGCIRRGDEAALRGYAHACVKAVHAVATGFGAPIVTIGLVQGHALGGGLEAALSFHVLIAERGVKFGFPEVLFGSFPGMGAYSFLSRKIGMREAQRMIKSGQMYSAEDFLGLGLVDVVAEKGEGEAAVQAWIAANRARHGLAVAHNRIRERLEPLELAELYDVTDIWVASALALSASDLRRMERLLGAQARQSAAAG